MFQSQSLGTPTGTVFRGNLGVIKGTVCHVRRGPALMGTSISLSWWRVIADRRTIIKHSAYVAFCVSASANHIIKCFMIHHRQIKGFQAFWSRFSILSASVLCVSFILVSLLMYALTVCLRCCSLPLDYSQFLRPSVSIQVCAFLFPLTPFIPSVTLHLSRDVLVRSLSTSLSKCFLSLLCLFIRFV